MSRANSLRIVAAFFQKYPDLVRGAKYKRDVRWRELWKLLATEPSENDLRRHPDAPSEYAPRLARSSLFFTRAVGPVAEVSPVVLARHWLGCAAADHVINNHPSMWHPIEGDPMPDDVDLELLEAHERASNAWSAVMAKLRAEFPGADDAYPPLAYLERLDQEMPHVYAALGLGDDYRATSAVATDRRTLRWYSAGGRDLI